MTNGGEVKFKFSGDDKDLKQKVNGLASNVGKVGAKIGKTVATGAAVATGAIATMVTASVKEFSNLEQLSGGAKKIFDEIDYSQIEKDAFNAYKNMNMSANEYLSAMNTVGATFASTLGDKKGYDTAQKGLQAISDYATGTGADIGTLTEKYKMITRSTSSYLSIADQFAGLLPQTTDGFLKQAQQCGYLSKQYTKLTEVPVEEYQVAITNMLEKGVDNMGLLGNTAEETEKTISGSLLAAKSAFKNFLSGYGKIDTVVDTFVIAGKNIGKAVLELLPTVIDGLVKLVNGLIPYIPQTIQKLLPILVQGVTTLLTSLVSYLPQFINILIQTLPTIIEQLTTMMLQISNALMKQLPSLIKNVVNGVLDILVQLLNHLPDFITTGVQLLIGLANGLIEALPDLIDRLPEIIEGIVAGLTTLAPTLMTVGPVLMIKLAEGLIKAIPKLAFFIPKITGAIISGLAKGTSEFVEIGGNLIKGLWKGMDNAVNWLVDKVKGFSNKVIKAVKGFFGIHSPSKEFAVIGKFNMLGLEEGMEDMQPDIQKTIDGMFNLSPNLYGTTANNLSMNPTIIVNNNVKTDPLGQVVNDIKTFSGGANNDYNYGGTM